MQQIGKIAIEHIYKNKRGEECQMDINAIPNNMEKYMAFMLGKHLVFLDSFQFMSSSLDNLAKNLPNEAFKYTQEEFKKDQFELMKQKGIYVKPFYRAETPKLDREPCVAAHLFVEESFTMITKTDRDWLE